MCALPSGHPRFWLSSRGTRAAHDVTRVASRGQPPNRVWLETAATLSFLRFGGDTRACRVFLELMRQPPLPELSLVEQLAMALDMPPAERASRIRRAEALAVRALAEAADRGVAAIPIGDDAYPDLLRHLPDPPLVLWAKGDLAWLGRPAVAVVGSRAATPAGLSIGRTLARGLASAGLVVVSGMARGVDAAAHEGALEADSGATVAVLGCGADRVYPAEHRTLAARIAERGAIASELAPGTPPLAHHFPLRNRIISGLSLGVVVVEASYKSGSLITARMALEQGRSVLAVPGGILSARHRGCHALIKDGARLVETIEDVLEELGWALPSTGSPAQSTKSLQMRGLAGTMAIGEAYSVDDLAARTGRTAADLLAELGGLEIAGRITRMAGGSYVRLD